MTNWGAKIPDASIDHLQARLAATHDGTAVKRLVVALAYKHGRSPAEIEETFGFPEATVYRWLDRFERRDLDDALSDDSRSGRPPKLSDAQFEELGTVLGAPPAEAGYDALAWSPRLVQHWLETRFDVEYSRRHVRRLMRDAATSE